MTPGLNPGPPTEYIGKAFPLLATLFADVLSNNAAFHDAHGRREVAIRPETLAPQKLFQLDKLSPQHPARSAFKRFDYLRHAEPRLYLNEQMQMLRLDG